jgi:hypothetical protein
LIQVTLSGNQEPVRVDITDAALEEGAEVSCFFMDLALFPSTPPSNQVFLEW